LPRWPRVTDLAPVGFGVLGAAAIARRSVLPAAAALPAFFAITGIASRDAGRRDACAAFGGARYDTYEALLADPAIQAVYIPLPNALHHKYVMMALSHGKHVLVEKPLGCSRQEVDDITRLATERRLAVLECFQFRFHSQLTVILEAVRDGLLGELRSVRVAFGVPPFPDADNIRYQAALGGGALFDLGGYALKLAPYFLGESFDVAHAAVSHDAARGVDVWGGGVLQQRASALQCQFAFGFDHQYQCALELWGSRGKLSTARIFTAPPTLCPVLTIETANRTERRVIPADDQVENMLRHFHGLITGSAEIAVEWDANRRQAARLEALRARATRDNGTAACRSSTLTG
jgi:dTDP-3,4-didehydro-2,6-dideoxy-alpha-D-glucose 3-reductase